MRHLVGGHSPQAGNERLMRFTFPERPGALFKFLSLMQPTWNISLFHYRNQGADYGRILVGMQVPQTMHRLLTPFCNSWATLGGGNRQPGLPAVPAAIGRPKPLSKTPVSRRLTRGYSSFL